MSDPDPMGRLLLQVEANAHRAGWDGPPAIYVLYDSTDVETERAYRHLMASLRGPAIRCGPYAAQSAVPSWALDGHPVHALFRFALNFAHGGDHPTVDVLVNMIRQPGFLGAAFLHEGWGREYRDLEARKAEGDVRFADMPGSMEYRGVLASDVAGNDYWVRRIRGRKPELHRPGVGDFKDAQGAVIESLRVIVAKVANMPVPDLVNVPSQWKWKQP